MRVEQWQRGTVSADFHHVLNQTLDRLVLAQFSFEAFAKGVDYGLSQRLAYAPGERSRQPIGIGVFDAKGHQYLARVF
jgi:hypothetical protein